MITRLMVSISAAGVGIREQIVLVCLLAIPELTVACLLIETWAALKLAFVVVLHACSET